MRARPWRFASRPRTRLRHPILLLSRPMPTSAQPERARQGTRKLTRALGESRVSRMQLGQPVLMAADYLVAVACSRRDRGCDARDGTGPTQMVEPAPHAHVGWGNGRGRGGLRDGAGGRVSRLEAGCGYGPGQPAYLLRAASRILQLNTRKRWAMQRPRDFVSMACPYAATIVVG